MHDPKIVRQLVEFTLNSFTLNGQVQDVELSELKYEIAWTLHEHVEFLENPEIDAGYKFITPPLLIHLNIKDFLQKLML